MQRCKQLQVDNNCLTELVEQLGQQVKADQDEIVCLKYAVIQQQLVQSEGHSKALHVRKNCKDNKVNLQSLGSAAIANQNQQWSWVRASSQSWMVPAYICLVATFANTVRHLT